MSMTNNLPNLSTWHPVPVGATIPKGTPYAYVYGDSLAVELDGSPCDKQVGVYYYTEHPIVRPPDKCPACRDYRRPCECGLL